MTRALAYVVSAICCASPVAAQELVFTGQYSYSQIKLKLADVACLNAAATKLGERFDGVTAVEIQSSEWWASALPGVQFFSYRNSVVVSEKGNVSADILCVSNSQTAEVTEVAYQFDAPGLHGIKRRVGMPESKYGMSFYSASVNAPEGSGNK